ncbi:MAG: hypothetical protein LBS31_05830 [Candidatus Adiutrix sp.]|jgi:hypothetical protein|nr:hypothetical protein [Candidatus Adiutrix sp.]
MTAPANPQPSAVSPAKALLLSAGVLPGLGQLLTGRPAKGALMAGSLLLWLPVAVVKAGSDLSRVMPQLMARAAAGQKIGFTDVQNALAPMAGDLTWLFMPLLAIWFWSVADSVIYWRQSGKKG